METSIIGSNFIFDYAHLFYYKCHKINFKCGGGVSPDWIKVKKAAKNTLSKKDNKRFQYAATVVLNHEEIKKDPQSITKFKSFVDKCNWEGINYPPEKDDWKIFGKNNLIIFLTAQNLKLFGKNNNISKQRV